MPNQIRHALLAMTAALVGTLLAGCESSSGTARSTSAPQLPWDWTGIIGTGQSLSVGARARAVLSTNQPYGNLKLATAKLPWPVDPNDPQLNLVPLVEPIGRLAPNYPSSWPENIDGETPHTAMANQLSVMVRAATGHDFVSVHSAVGEDGQGMIYIKKYAVQHGLNGQSYIGALTETRAITRLAKAAGKTYGVGAIVISHGETDAGNHDYEAELYQLWSDYNTDLPAITGQTRKLQMIISQQNSLAEHSASTQAQWQAGVDHPADLVCSGPKYQYPYFKDGVHLLAAGYQMLGEKYAQVYYQRVILGNNWQPLQPVAIERSGAVITVRFHVPAPPLAWDTNFSNPHPSIAQWHQGRGFEVTSAAGERITITSAEISGDAVILTCAADPGPGTLVSYAMVSDHLKMSDPYPGTTHWGLLRDSDPFIGATTQKPQPNYCVAFDLPAP